jgi:chromosome segregation ATPase
LKEKYGQIIDVKSNDEESHSVPVLPPRSMEAITEIIKQNSMLLEKLFEYERRISEIEKTQQKTQQENAELKAEVERLSRQLTVIAGEKEQYQEQVKQEIQEVKKSVDEQLTAWRREAKAAQQEVAASKKESFWVRLFGKRK